MSPRVACLALSLLVVAVDRLPAQAGFEDDRVMLQGFYWESCRHGHPKYPQFGQKKWYAIVRDQAERLKAGRIDLVWLPPPSFAGEEPNAGYAPKQYYKLDNSYGDWPQHRAMLEALLKNGVEPVADVVINHRNGNQSWADFVNPEWGAWAICRDDEAFSLPSAPASLKAVPVEKRGAAEEAPIPYDTTRPSTLAYEPYRDIDHTNATVRRDLIRYLLLLKSAGYRGWRYDMVHGYHARWIALYNRRSQPTFSVGEYDWDKLAASRGWAWHTAAVSGDPKSASSVFDFATHFALKESKGQPAKLHGKGPGLLGDSTDGIPWRNRAVTFAENHDTGRRTRSDGTVDQEAAADSFASGAEIEQAYAYLLTHPGVPCVFWKHYFDWGNGLSSRIDAPINARKVAGVHAGSVFHPQDNAKAKGVYAARVQGRHGDLYVRVGGGDEQWQPHHSGYRNFREYAVGDGWKVWVAIPGNPPVKQAALKGSLPIPEPKKPTEIAVPNEWLQ